MVAVAEQIIADVDRRRNPMRLMQGRLAVAIKIAIFNVIVNERRFVKNFDRLCRMLDPRRQLFDVLFAIGSSTRRTRQSIVHSERNERSIKLSTAAQKIEGERLC